MMHSSFHIGVVEDRHDPKQMGRVRVRVLGLHSDDRVNDVPINTLPWSLVMQPTNASSASGGISQLVEGTWVIVMYTDKNYQDPIVIGSLPSSVGSQSPDYTKGFSDPFGVYPKYSDGESDTTLIGKEDRWTEHPTYTQRQRTRMSSIPQAKKYKTSTVSEDKDDTEYERPTWEESDLRAGSASQYPYNNVREYEGGMVEEFDSTPSSQRMTRMHPSGTYEEIVVDGSRTTKIVGDGYTITLGDHNMYVRGNLNVTVEGNLRQFVEGDYILEVGGEFTQMIKGNRTAKLLENDVIEIGQDQSINIRKNQNLKVGKNQTIRITDNRRLSIGIDDSVDIGNNSSRVILNDLSQVVANNSTEVTAVNKKETAGGTYVMESVGNMTIDTDANFVLDVSGTSVETIGSTLDITAGGDITAVGGSNINLGPNINLNP